MTEPLPGKDISGKADALIELQHWLEENPTGSTESKAFCDLVDQYEMESVLDPQTLKDNPGPKLLTIGETIRQRGNEFPGYLSANQHVHELVKSMEKAVTSKIDWYYTDQGVTYDPRPKVSHQLSTIKLKHITPPTPQE